VNTEPDRRLRVVSLRAEGFMRLTAVDITPDPDGSLVVIAGRNGQGKSSVLHAIWAALSNAAAARGIPCPINNDRETATVRLDLGDIVVTRRWTEKGTTLKVENGEGASFSRPQAMLDRLIGSLSFDPLGFVQQRESDQVKTLLDLIDLPEDPRVLDARRNELYMARTGVNRTVKALEGQLAGMPAADPSTPAVEVSAASIVAEMTAAQAECQRIDQARADVDRAQREAEQHRAEADRLDAEIQRLTVARDARRAAAEDATSTAARDRAAAEGMTRPDMDGFAGRLAEVDVVNRAVREARDRQRVADELAAARAESERLTRDIDDVDETKRTILEEADMPLPGLGFAGDGVTFGGVPLRQCSSSEQLRVSVAIAMRLNPTVRVIRVQDGSLLDTESLRMIEEMAAENGYQVWCEMVRDAGAEGVGIVIEDGQVAS
jgi:energy-coupling factor transporter ATP-binding protein EcfA2